MCPWRPEGAVVSRLVGAGSSATEASVCNSYQAISLAPAARNFNSVPVYGSFLALAIWLKLL